MSVIKLFHGTDHIIEMPNVALGNVNNDYGRGFYCTRDVEAAKEWACKKNTNGFVNVYNLNMSGLNVLNLSDGKHSVLNWISILLQFRTFKLNSEIASEARDYLIKHYAVNLEPYDVVVGYRADDSYFQYAEAFISNALPLRCLNQALRLGKLGEQTVVISQRGFDRLLFIESYPVDKNIYFPKFKDRDTAAREKYRKEIKRSKAYHDDLFIMDILRKGVDDDDARI